MSTAKIRASRIRLMGFDIDGTLTDGGLYFGPSQEEFKRFSVFDGQGLRFLSNSGIVIAWITARSSQIVEQRAQDLKIPHVVQGCKNKLSAFDELRQQYGLEWAQCGFFGDDWPDFPLLRNVGFAATTATAPLRLRATAHWVAKRTPGNGAARELADFICANHPQGVKPWLA